MEGTMAQEQDAREITYVDTDDGTWAVMRGDEQVAEAEDEADAEQMVVSLRREAEAAARKAAERAQRAAVIQGIRELADFLEQHPELPVASVHAGRYAFRAPNDRDEAITELRACAAAMAPNTPEIKTPSYGTSEVRIEAEFAGGVDYTVDWPAERVSEPVQVTATEYRLPADLLGEEAPVEGAGGDA